MSWNRQPAVKSKPARATTPEPDHDTIAALAYQLWILRARPVGSPEVDWLRAEAELKEDTYAFAKSA